MPRVHPESRVRPTAEVRARPRVGSVAKPKATPKRPPEAGSRAKPRAEVPEGARHLPQQERSKRRFDAIVEAAAQLFAEEPFPSVTMEAIAQRAGTPIGSVYQFWKDKRAIFAAVMARSNARAREAFEGIAQAASAGQLLPFPVVLDAAIDGFAALQASDPAIRAANKNLTFLGELVHEDEALQRELAERTAELFALYFPEADARTRRLVATIVVDLVTSFLVLADRREQPPPKRLLDECKLVVRLYVEERLAPGR